MSGVRRYVPLKEAAHYVGTSERWVRDEIRAGRLPAFKTNPGKAGHVRVRLEDLDVLMQANALDPKEMESND